MSSDTGVLALCLVSPLQSWGVSSRFQRRTTGLYPSKSGVVGMICAAMGLAKGSAEEQELLPRLVALRMTTLSVPRFDVRRMEDFHTVLDTRRASGAPNHDPVITRRQFLVDARFGVLLYGDRMVLARVSAALQDPVWGVWFGRKACIPAEPIHRGLFEQEADALRALIGDRSLQEFTSVAEVEQFADGTDSLCDQPVSFGDGRSSGPDGRRFSLRRISLRPAAARPGTSTAQDGEAT